MQHLNHHSLNTAFFMLLHLNITVQRSIIFTWYLAWMLITVMPVIHAHSATLSNQSNHCPVASMELFDNMSMDMGGMPAPESKEPTQFYHCPLCHCAYLLFEDELHITFKQNIIYINHAHHQDSLHSLILLFKPARSPPSLYQFH